jgi:hypothetical protein
MVGEKKLRKNPATAQCQRRREFFVAGREGIRNGGPIWAEMAAAAGLSLGNVAQVFGNFRSVVLLECFELGLELLDAFGFTLGQIVLFVRIGGQIEKLDPAVAMCD